MSLFRSDKTAMPTTETALPGRADQMPVAAAHYVLGTPMPAAPAAAPAESSSQPSPETSQPSPETSQPSPDPAEKLLVGMGCFWGAERKFWELAGVLTTAVGYSGGLTPNPSYEEVCSGLTGHNEVVLAVFNPQVISYRQMLSVFWENHDPTQGMRQGNDVGTQYRSGIYTFSPAQRQAAEESRDDYQQVLSAAGYGQITTEILAAGEFYFAEDYHQQYLAKNPMGYCGLGGTGLSMPQTASQPAPA